MLGAQIICKKLQGLEDERGKVFPVGLMYE